VGFGSPPNPITSSVEGRKATTSDELSIKDKEHEVILLCGTDSLPLVFEDEAIPVQILRPAFPCPSFVFTIKTSELSPLVGSNELTTVDFIANPASIMFPSSYKKLELKPDMEFSTKI
jgi:hypothetical protein